MIKWTFGKRSVAFLTYIQLIHKGEIHGNT
jgi:hypothetical protein